ncbi:MAG: serine hydrolase [Ignavibacteria bacterium]|nr:serine hydrolase [Ignavibacteria bacterium]
MKILLLILLFPLITFAADVNENLEKYLDECYKEKLFSGTVLILKDFKPVFEKSYGYSNINSGELNSSDTKYNIASIGKTFTLTLILKLYEEGKLKLDDKLSDYLDLFKQDKFKDITIRHLITHTSGLGDFINRDLIANKSKLKSLDDILEIISREVLEFKPGTGKKYSNSGYCLLGGIIEKVTGKKYKEYLEERIFDNLEMENYFYGFPQEKIDLKATGYMQDIKGNLRPADDMLIGSNPAGGVYVTVNDMIKFNYSLFNDNKLLKDENKLLLLTELNEGKDRTFAELINNPNFSTFLAGGSPGFNSLYFISPSEGYTGFIFTNLDNAAERIEKGIVQILRGKKPDMPMKPIGRYLYDKLNEKGKDYFISNIKNIVNEGNFNLDWDGLLNNAGYQFLNNGLNEEAIAIFKLNVEYFPGVANCYDSLAEAYLISGNKSEAKKYYEMALNLDPDNNNIKKAIESLNQ